MVKPNQMKPEPVEAEKTHVSTSLTFIEVCSSYRLTRSEPVEDKLSGYDYVTSITFIYPSSSVGLLNIKLDDMLFFLPSNHKLDLYDSSYHLHTIPNQTMQTRETVRSN